MAPRGGELSILRSLSGELHRMVASRRSRRNAHATGRNHGFRTKDVQAKAEPGAVQAQKPPTRCFVLQAHGLASAFSRAPEALPEKECGPGALEHHPRTSMRDEGLRATHPAAQLDGYATTEGEGVFVGLHAANTMRAATRASETQSDHGPRSRPSTWSDGFRCIAQSRASYLDPLTSLDGADGAFTCPCCVGSSAGRVAYRSHAASATTPRAAPRYMRSLLLISRILSWLAQSRTRFRRMWFPASASAGDCMMVWLPAGRSELGNAGSPHPEISGGSGWSFPESNCGSRRALRGGRTAFPTPGTSVAPARHRARGRRRTQQTKRRRRRAAQPLRS